MRTLCIALSLVIGSSVARATDWPHLRGPFYNGSTDEKDLPEEWSRTENVAWSADLPGPSASTPIVHGDRVYVSSTGGDDDGGLFALAFDRESGDPAWMHRIGDNVRQDARSTYAAPTPTTDGERVIFFYGSGELVAYSPGGDEVWKRDITDDYGEFAFQWTFASSPLLHGGKLYLQVLQRDEPARGRGRRGEPNESYLLAMNPANGKTLWRVVRPSKAVAESREAFTSPVPFTLNGKEQLVVVGGDALTGHDLSSGEELWRWGTWNPERIGHWRLVPSPVACGDIVLACAPKKDPIYAIEPKGEGRLGDDAIAWVSRDERRVSSDVPTPACYDGSFFVLSDVRKALSRVTPKTGEVEWSVDLPGFPKYEASPLVADGKVYTVNFKGEVTIVRAKDGEIVRTIAMEEDADSPVRSSIVAAGGQLFVRTNTKIWCIGKK